MRLFRIELILGAVILAFGLGMALDMPATLAYVAPATPTPEPSSALSRRWLLAPPYTIAQFGPLTSPAGALRRHRNQLAALWGTSLFFAEGVADCVQTSTRISHFGTHENNPLTPPVVITEFHRDHPGLCILGFSATSGAWYAATHRMDWSLQPWAPVIEGLNLGSQAH